MRIASPKISPPKIAVLKIAKPKITVRKILALRASPRREIAPGKIPARNKYAAAKNFALRRECGGIRGLDAVQSSIVAKNLSGAQKHIAQDCKDDRDPSFA